MNKMLPDYINSLYHYLKHNKPNNLIIPCTSHKNPIFKHKNNAWNWDLILKNQNEFGPDKHQAILVKDFVVIDFDNRSLAEKYENMFPILKTCPLVETFKGYHYYFERTKECDMYGLYDQSRCFGRGNDELDFKSICSTGTAGVVVVPPSKHKTWIRKLWKTSLPKFTGDILNYFNNNWASRRYEYVIKADPILKTPKRTIINDIDEDSKFDKIDLSDDEFVKIKNIINCINDERSIDYSTWSDMCWCLKNISAQYNNSDKLFENLWIEFSSKCPDKFNKEESLGIWHNTVPRKSGLKIGTLIMWAKNDDPNKYLIIHNKSSNVSDVVKKLITDFVKKEFHHPPTKISSINIKDYDNNNYIFVNIDEIFCNICDMIHDKPQSFIIINNTQAYEKCHLSSEKSNTRRINNELKEVMNEVFVDTRTPEKAVHDLIIEYEDKDPIIKDMNITQLSPQKDNFLATKFDVIESKVCPIHNIVHDDPSNCVCINMQKALMGIGCNIDQWGRIYPENGLNVPKQVINILGNVNINNVTNNYYNNNSDNPICLMAQDYLQDNLPFYNDNEDKHLLLLESLPGKHNDIARFVNCLYKDEFRYVPDNWYIFLNHIWKKSNIPILRDRLSGDFCSIYKDILTFYRESNDIDSYEYKIKQIDSLTSNLKITHFKNSIMEECKEIFMIANQTFNETVNCANILPFNNGVIEIDTLNFRDGKGDDNMIMSTNIDYIPYDPDNIIMKELLQFLADILPDILVREYLMKIFALSLTKTNKLQKFWILTGEGSNGKSLLIGLLDKVLGDFSRTLNSSIVTGKSENLNESNDAVSSLEYIRSLIINEPAESEIIQAKKVKMICGGRDKISVRGLFEKQKEYLPEFKAILKCNKTPLLSENTFAEWRRIRLIDFPVKFVDEPDPNNPLEKQVDEDLDNKIDLWAPYFAGYLVYWLRIIYDEGGFKNIKEPQAVMKRTQKYKDDNDPWKEFRELYIVKNEDSYIQWKDLRPEFNKWLDNNDLRNNKKASDIKDYFEKHLGKYMETTKNNNNIKGFLGFSLKKVYYDYDFDPLD